ncbi:MAG: hypothetical protein R2839_04775 [Thermomicrobiales bacterium]
MITIGSTRWLTVLILAALLLLAPASVLAQGRGSDVGRSEGTEEPATPPAVTAPSTGIRLDLAAMALDSLDIPAELFLTFETYYDFEDVMLLMIGDTVDRAAMEATGLQWFYQSTYATPSGSTSIRSYAEEYADESGAIAGFDVLENEATFVPDAAFTDEPLELGDGPGEITVGSYEATVPDTGPTSIDLTFRIGRVVAGVGIDMQEGLTVDRDLAMQLAQRLEERVRAILSGTPVPAIDTTLPERYVQLGVGWFTTNEGYWTIPDLYGADVAADIISGFRSGYFWAGGYDLLNVGGFPLPRAAIEVASFGTERAALLLLSSMTTLRPNMQTFQVLDVESIPGTSVTLGYQFANQFFGESTLDSVRLIMLTGSTLVTIDVQGNGDVGSALAAAEAIAVPR